MERISDVEKATRFARVVMDNIGLYEEKTVKQAINSGDFFDLMQSHIDEARGEFNSRVSEEIASSNVFDLALCDVLVKRAYKHRTPEDSGSE